MRPLYGTRATNPQERVRRPVIIGALEAAAGPTTYEKAGIAAAGTRASAADVHEAVEAGSVRAGSRASGGGVWESVEAGSVRAGSRASGPSEKVTVYEKTGIVAAGTLASGADVHEAVEAGSVRAGSRASAADVHEAVETGSVRTSARASAADTFTATEVGKAIAGSRASGTATKTSLGQGDSLPDRMPESHTTTIYVATAGGGGDDGNAGTIGSPKLTITGGILALTDGVGGTVFVRTGSYGGFENWNRDGASTNPVTVSAYTTDDPSEPDATFEAVTVTGRVDLYEPYFRLRGITVDYSGGSGEPGVYAHDHSGVPASHLELDRCIVQDAGGDGVFLEGGATAGTRIDDFQMHRCTIRNNGTDAELEHGFYPKWATNWTVSDCLFHDNAASNAHIGNASDGGLLANSTLVRPGGIQSAVIWSEATGERSDNNRIVNCILSTELVNVDTFETSWGGGTAGTGNVIDQTIANGASGTGVNFNTSNGGVTLQDTSTADPDFVDPDGNDWQVLEGSPAIGYTDSAYESLIDFNGTDRTLGVIGAFGTPIPVGTLYEKAGLAATGARASGADVHQATEAGSVLAGSRASAADVHEAVEAGSAISGPRASATDAFTATETGSAVAGSRASAADVHEAVETGSAQIGSRASGVSEHTVGGTIYTKAGLAAAGSRASGADAFTATETGAVQAGSRQGALDVFTATETASPAVGSRASATDAFTATESGSAIVGSRASGTSVHVVSGVFAKAGIAAAGTRASAADVRTATETGAAIAGSRASGTSQHIASVVYAKSGIVAAGARASGADVYFSTESGLLILGTRQAGGDAATHARTGVVLIGTRAGGFAGGESPGRVDVKVEATAHILAKVELASYIQAKIEAAHSLTARAEATGYAEAETHSANQIDVLVEA